MEEIRRAENLNARPHALKVTREPSETERLAIIASLKDASKQLNMEYDKFRNEQGGRAGGDRKDLAGSGGDQSRERAFIIYRDGARALLVV